MGEPTTTTSARLASLEERVKKLAADKSNLQLIVGLMSRVGAIAGLDNVVEHMLHGVSDLIGGVNVKLYYHLNDALWCADLLQGRRQIASVDDDAVQRATETREIVEIEHAFGDTQMMGPEFTNAYTWAVPLLVGTELVGVLKMESLHVAMRDLSHHLPTFFSFAALVLKNEISGQSRLQKAYADLGHEVAVRKEAEAQLRRANEELESRVARRTEELRAANGRLIDSDRQIRQLLRESETARTELVGLLAEQKAAQERLRHIAAIVESTDDAIIGKTLDEKIVSWNRGAEQIYGYTAAEMIGQSLSVLVPADRQEELDAIMARLKNGERIRHYETERLRKDGKSVSVALTISPITDTHGRIVGASTIARDITERKRMEEGLLFVAQRGWQSGGEDFLNALARFLCEKLEMEYAFIDTTDENRDVAETVALCVRGEITPNMRYALKGTPCENVMGRNLCVYRQGIQQLFPEDDLLPKMGAESYVGIPLWDSAGGPIGLIAVMSSKPLADTAPVTQLLQLVATRAAAELERKRSEEALVRLNAELEQRVRDRTAELQREIDSRQRQQQFLEAVLETTDAGIVACDADGVLTLFNRKSRELHGLPATPIPAEEWAQRYALFQSDGRTPMRKEDVPLFRALQGERVVGDEMMIIPRGGEPAVLLASGQTIMDKSGRKIGAVVAMHDITERKRAEQAIRKLNTELQQRATALEAANRELESFSYSVSHDLRAPLRSIDGFSRILLEESADRLDAEARENLETICAATQRMNHLIEDLLRLSRLNRSEMRWTTVNLSSMVREVVRDLKVSEPGRKAEIIIAPDCVVRGDAALLRIALENILGNAWKYTGRKPQAKIEFGATETSDGRRAFFVRDNGCGFEMKYAGRLFGAFQRLHTAEEFPGTGIGLASVQRVIRRHGGDVWIEGEAGVGATLYFSIPDSVTTP